MMPASPVSAARACAPSDIGVQLAMSVLVGRGSSDKIGDSGASVPQATQAFRFNRDMGSSTELSIGMPGRDHQAAAGTDPVNLARSDDPASPNDLKSFVQWPIGGLS